MFWFDLAGHLGCTVGELRDRISSRELTHWIAYYQLSPFGPRQDDYRSGAVAATLANQWLKKGASARQPWHFFPSLKPVRPRSDLDNPEILRAKLAALAKGLQMRQQQQQ